METTSAEMKTIVLPLLAFGETYAGLILKDDGTPSHHVILLAADHENMTFKKAQELAVSISGELPTRQEQSLLFANCKKHFKSDWYWSGEERASGSACAWCQDFTSGSQSYSGKDLKLRCRFVRRLPI